MTFIIPVHRKLTEFQQIINSHFDKSFKKQTFTLTYKNRYPWMTNSIAYVDTIVNSIVISYMDVKNTILSLKNSSHGYDEFPAFIAKQCIDNYVVPLTYVINMSLMEGIFPSELKLAKVVPMFKSGESDKVHNYRPISVLSFFSKIFEKIMYNNVVNFMDFINISLGSGRATPLTMLL